MSINLTLHNLKKTFDIEIIEGYFKRKKNIKKNSRLYFIEYLF